MIDKADIHYHVIIEYDGIRDTTAHTSFTAAVDKARKEILVERLLDSGLAKALRRKFTRREWIPGIYAQWIGRSHRTDADASIQIEVSACTSGLHHNV